jgi:hypothetical protein
MDDESTNPPVVGAQEQQPPADIPATSAPEEPRFPENEMMLCCNSSSDPREELLRLAIREEDCGHVGESVDNA